MFVITPILSATGIMLGVSAAVAIAIVVNEAGIFLKARKQGGEGAAKPKREKLSKKAKRKIEKTSGSEAYKAALADLPDGSQKPLLELKAADTAEADDA